MAVDTCTVTVRYFAAAQEAAGLAEEAVALDRTTTLQDLLEDSARRHGPRLAAVLSRCSVLLDGIAVRNHATVLTHGQALDVLPPFAGG